MTRLTAMIIKNDPRVYSAAYGPVKGKFGLYVGTLDTAPSGWERTRVLVTSEAIYDTPELAKAAADELITATKAMVLPEG